MPTPATPSSPASPCSGRWARLREAITPAHLTEADSAACVVAIAPSVRDQKSFGHGSAVTVATETVTLLPGHHNNTPAILVNGVDARGLVYGLLELADRIRSSPDPIAALHLTAPIIETTPNKVRSVSRAFCSELEDKPWFYDRAFWIAYLDTLAAARFNRFAFTLGLAYDFPRGVTGDYLHFPYPYLVEVPGYPQVHVEPALAPGERQRNLETLQFIGAETARRGLDFQLGLWTHAYEWTDSPHSDHHIAGLTPETHAAYCRDALAALLKACPQITGLTMRIHGESGIPEGSYDFWQTLFSAVAAARTSEGKPRIIELDLHAKGLDQRTIDIARATGMPVKAGCKFWAEHLGLGYHQADIRAAEYPKAGVTGTFAVSAGARNFTRYGYGDFYQYPQGLAAGQSIDILYRVWPGTQRHLLWGDPALASGYGRAANFCGAAGLELMEPLFFKGREGSGRPGGRDAYADSALGSPSLDTAKFAITYMLWGRYLYNPENPDTNSAFYHRYLYQTFGAAGPAVERALAASSRILPLITTTWLPSASNHDFWPEMFTPLQILPYSTRPLYTDNPAPHNVSAISPLDPQLFTTIAQHAENLVSGKADARYNTSEVIASLESLVVTSSAAIARAPMADGLYTRTPEFRRAQEDILILNGLGSYFANLFRAALFCSIYEQKFDSHAADAAMTAYGKARSAWATMSDHAKSVYSSDISYGSTAWRGGHWADRLAAIDADIDVLSKHIMSLEVQRSSTKPRPIQPQTQRALNPVPRPSLFVTHTSPESFQPGSDLTLSLKAQPVDSRPVPWNPEIILWYRHVNHGERWLSMTMQRTESIQRSDAMHSATIPAAYTNSPYPLQYYFELRTASAATLHPPFNSTWSNQPYFAIHHRT